MSGFVRAIELVSAWAIPVFLVLVPLYALARRVNVYAAFVEGAKEGFTTGVRIIPYLVAILAAVGAFRGAGAMDLLSAWVRPVTDALAIPVSVLPMMIVRPLSGGGATGVLAEILKNEGPDGYAGILASVMMGSSETTFYVLAVYFGAIGITRYRHALPAALIADLAGYVASILVVRLIFF